MNIFAREKNKDVRTIGVLDIGSASVGGALVRYSEQERPEILWSTCVAVSVPDIADADHLQSMIVRATTDVAQQLAVSCAAQPEEIIVTMSAPWVASQTRLLHQHKSEKFVFTKELADELIAREINRYHDGKIKEWADFVEDHELLEHKTMRVRLNGYVVSEPVGKRVTSVDIASFMSIIEKSLMHRIQAAIGRVFHSHISIHSFIFASYATIKQAFHNNDDAVIVDLGGEITEIGIIRNDVLMQTLSFPFGRNAFLRHVSLGLNTTQQEARSIMRMYRDGALSEQRLYEVEPIIKRAGDIWLERFKEVLNDVAETSLIPDMLFLHADEEMMSFMTQLIESEDTHQYISSHRPFSVVPMDLTALKGYVIDQQMKHDPFLVVAALFANTLAHREVSEEANLPAF